MVLLKLLQLVADTVVTEIMLPCEVRTSQTLHKVGSKFFEFGPKFAQSWPKIVRRWPKPRMKFSTKLCVEMETYFPHLPYTSIR